MIDDIKYAHLHITGPSGFFLTGSEGAVNSITNGIDGHWSIREITSVLMA